MDLRRGGLFPGQPVYYAVIYGQSASLLPQYVAGAVPSHEVAEAVTDPSPSTGWTNTGDHEEIDDNYAWQFMFTLNGFLMMAPSGPTGQVIQPSDPTGQTIHPTAQQLATSQTPSPPQPNPFVELSQLSAIPMEQFNALAFRMLALIDPRDFTARAAAAQQQLEQNPMLPTPQGRQAASLGWAMFAQVLSPD